MYERAAYYHLKNNHCFKGFLTQEALVTVVHVFVTSHIDYYNSLLYGISDYSVSCLQPVSRLKSYSDCAFSVAAPTLPV